MFLYFVFKVLIHQGIPNTLGKQKYESPNTLGKITANLKSLENQDSDSLNSLLPNSIDTSE